jgi:1-acyl-sn-glycerol-3-phosphate acyltransferase
MRRGNGCDARGGHVGAGLPEGTVRSGATLLPFRTGAFRAAARAGRPVIPIAIGGTPDILPRPFRLLNRGTIHVTILPPLHPDKNARDSVDRVRDHSARAIAAVLTKCAADETSFDPRSS